MKKEKGITLIALVITVIILIILASLTTYSGMNTVKSIKLTKFKQELEIMQSQVNLLYEKCKNEDTIDIGKEIASSGKKEFAEKAFEACEVTDTTGYKLFDSETIKELGIEGIEREYLVDIKGREVISLEGVKYNEQIYYNLYQITGQKNIKQRIERGDVTFDINIKEQEEGWLVTISNIEFSKYVGKGKIQYQNLETNKITTIEKEAKENQSYSFAIQNEGNYKIQVVDAAGIIAEEERTLEFGFYEVDGTLYYKTLPEAIESAQDGSTIKVLKNTTETASITIDKDIILDTNGKAINYVGENKIRINENKNVAIKGNGTISGETKTSLILNNGNMEIDSVTIESNLLGYMYSTIVTLGNGKIISNNGKISGISTQGEVTINGGQYGKLSGYPSGAGSFTINDATVNEIGLEKRGNCKN